MNLTGISPMGTDLEAECEHCGNEFKSTMYEMIDGNIVEIIRILNLSGIHTAASCEGHGDHSAYIQFNNVTEDSMDYYLYILDEFPLPETWYVDEECIEEYEDNGCTVYQVHENMFEPVVVIRSERGISKERYLNDLYDWTIKIYEVTRERK